MLRLSNRGVSGRSLLEAGPLLGRNTPKVRRSVGGFGLTQVLLGGSLAISFSLPASGTPSQEPPATFKSQPTDAATAQPDQAPTTENLEIEGLGLRIRPPEPSFSKSETVDGVLRFELVDAEASPRWWLIFQSLTSSTAGTTARGQLDAYLETLRKNNKEYEVKVNENFTVPGASDEARVLLIERAVAEDAKGISGWLIIPNGTDRFITCSIALPSRTFDIVWPGVERSLRSIELRSAQEIAESKRQRIEAGAQMLRFSRDTLKAALQPEPVCYRMFRPGPVDGDRPARVADEREVGWMVVRSREGLRGEVDPKANVDKLRGEDADPGILVQIDAKSIVNDDGSNTVDTQIRAWLSWDREEEVWSARTTQRQGNASRSSAQTGVRSPAKRGDPRPMLRVINSTAEKVSRDPQEWAVPPNYISQAELILLGRLLPKDDPGPRTFSSYSFEPKSNGLPQRRDTWKREADGTWTLETFLGSTTVPLIQTFDERGERQRRVDIDTFGTLVTERIDLVALKAIWRSKGLPLE